MRDSRAGLRPRVRKAETADGSRQRAYVWLRMTYRCCGMEWTDEWPSVFKFECPDCGVLVEATAVVEIG